MRTIPALLAKKTEKLFLRSIVRHDGEPFKMNVRTATYDPVGQVDQWMAIQIAPPAPCTFTFRVEMKDIANFFSSCEIETHSAVMNKNGVFTGPVVRVSGIKDGFFICCDIYMQPTEFDI